MIAPNEIEIKSQSRIGSTIYINALCKQSQDFVELAIVSAHRQTGEEVLLDALLPDDRIGTVFSVIRLTLGNNWTLCDSWEIKSDQQQIA